MAHPDHFADLRRAYIEAGGSGDEFQRVWLNDWVGSDDPRWREPFQQTDLSEFLIPWRDPQPMTAEEVARLREKLGSDIPVYHYHTPAGPFLPPKHAATTVGGDGETVHIITTLPDP